MAFSLLEKKGGVVVFLLLLFFFPLEQETTSYFYLYLFGFWFPIHKCDLNLIAALVARSLNAQSYEIQVVFDIS